jgi:hypothetical protein
LVFFACPAGAGPLRRFFVVEFGAFGVWFVWVGLLAFPCFVSGVLALPLCGAAPTFLCLPQRKVGKRKRLYTASS